MAPRNPKQLPATDRSILWGDDGQIVELHLTKRYDKENPGADMAVIELS